MTPEGWSEMPLGDVASFIGSGVTPRGGSSVYVPNGVPFLRSQNVHFGGLVLDDVAFVTAELHADMKRTHVQPLDVLLNITGASIGRCTYVPEDFGRANVNQHVCIVRCEKGKADPRYIAHYLSSPRGQDEIRSRQAGLSREALNYEQVRALRVLKPPLPEQRKIAAILSSVDDAIDKTQAVIDQLAVVKKAMMQELLTKGLPGRHTRFKQTEIGMVPEEWVVVPLGAVCQRITDGSHQSVATSPSGDVPFLYVSCIRDGRILWDKAARISGEQYSTVARGREPAVGSVLYTAVGSYGHAAAVVDDKRFTFQRHIAYLVPESNQLDPSFLAGWLNSPSGRDHADRVAVGNAQKTVTLGKLKDFPLPLPPLEEQDRIASVAQSLDNRMNAEAEGRDALRTLKSALMSVLLTGEVRVTPDEDEA